VTDTLSKDSMLTQSVQNIHQLNQWCENWQGDDGAFESCVLFVDSRTFKVIMWAREVFNSER
jgi:hypothetical protein